MVAWQMTLKTPECPEGRDIIVISNDITYKIGSFGPAEDLLFKVRSSLYMIQFSKNKKFSQGYDRVIECDDLGLNYVVLRLSIIFINNVNVFRNSQLDFEIER